MTMKQIAISYMTYKKFAKRYGIRLTNTIGGKRVRKNMRLLSDEIRTHEEKNKPSKPLLISYS